MFRTSNKTVIGRGKFFSHTNIKANRFTRDKICNRFTTDQGTYRFKVNDGASNSFTSTIIASVKRLVNRRKNNRFIKVLKD